MHVAAGRPGDQYAALDAAVGQAQQVGGPGGRSQPGQRGRARPGRGERGVGRQVHRGGLAVVPCVDAGSGLLQRHLHGVGGRVVTALKHLERFGRPAVAAEGDADPGAGRQVVGAQVAIELHLQALAHALQGDLGQALRAPGVRTHGVADGQRQIQPAVRGDVGRVGDGGSLHRGVAAQGLLIAGDDAVEQVRPSGSGLDVDGAVRQHVLGDGQLAAAGHAAAQQVAALHPDAGAGHGLQQGIQVLARGGFGAEHAVGGVARLVAQPAGQVGDGVVAERGLCGQLSVRQLCRAGSHVVAQVVGRAEGSVGAPDGGGGARVPDLAPTHHGAHLRDAGGAEDVLVVLQPDVQVGDAAQAVNRSPLAAAGADQVGVGRLAGGAEVALDAHPASGDLGVLVLDIGVRSGGLAANRYARAALRPCVRHPHIPLSARR